MGRFDKLAWEIIHNRTPAQSGNKGLKSSGRPASFAELEQMIRTGETFDIAWPMFLDEFYTFRTPDFFEVEPGNYFDPKTRAWFAGTVEYLCHRFALPVPAWVEKPEYFLSEYYKLTTDAGEPEFKRRNIGYDPRGLIRL